MPSDAAHAPLGIGLLIAVLVLVVLAAVVSLALRQFRLYWLEQISIDEERANDIRAELLDYVKENSFGEKQQVSLLPFWRARRLREADRHLVAGPLFNSRDLIVHRRAYGSSWEAMLEQLRQSWA